jgi:hypothetical protein
MKPLFLFIIFACTASQAQNNAQTAAIVAEGKAMFRSEMASWYGTDIFLEKFKDQRDSIGGYFSYLTANNMASCVFFSRGDQPKVLATITFDSTYNLDAAKVDGGQRDFLPYEQDLYTIRKKAYEAIAGDTLFKSYQNTRFNLVPMLSGNEKKVYVLTGPAVSGVVVFGNDYLISFDNNNNITGKKQLHRNILPMPYGNDRDPDETGTIHTHLPETGDYITSTDICTLMLYSKFAKWKQHLVVSEKYVCIWNCETNSLVTVPRNVWDKINKDQEKRRNN